MWFCVQHYYTDTVWAIKMESIFCKLLCTPCVWSLKTCHFYLCYNFGKCGPILTLLSLLYSQINCRSRNKTYHLNSNLLPHYVAKFECLTVTLFIKTRQNTYQTFISVTMIKGSTFVRLIYFLAYLLFLSAVWSFDVIVIFSDSRLQRLLNVWHSIENASSTHPLTIAVCATEIMRASWWRLFWTHAVKF